MKNVAFFCPRLAQQGDSYENEKKLLSRGTRAGGQTATWVSRRESRVAWGALGWRMALRAPWIGGLGSSADGYLRSITHSGSHQ